MTLRLNSMKTKGFPPRNWSRSCTALHPSESTPESVVPHIGADTQFIIPLANGEPGAHVSPWRARMASIRSDSSVSLTTPLSTSTQANDLAQRS